MLWHLGALRTQEVTAPSRVSQVFETAKNFPSEHTSHMQTNQSLVSALQRLLYLSYSMPIFPSPWINPGPGIKQLGTSPTGQRLPKLFNLSNPKLVQLAYRVLSIASHENHDKGSGPWFPLTPSTPRSPNVPPWGCARHGTSPLLGNTTQLFCQGSCLCVCHLTIHD